jgi:hypothetical protein
MVHGCPGSRWWSWQGNSRIRRGYDIAWWVPAELPTSATGPWPPSPLGSASRRWSTRVRWWPGCSTCFVTGTGGCRYTTTPSGPTGLRGCCHRVAWPCPGDLPLVGMGQPGRIARAERFAPRRVGRAPAQAHRHRRSGGGAFAQVAADRQGRSWAFSWRVVPGKPHAHGNHHRQVAAPGHIGLVRVEQPPQQVRRGLGGGVGAQDPYIAAPRHTALKNTRYSSRTPVTVGPAHPDAARPLGGE